MAFRGKRVMLSSTAVPPEMFDRLHGILKENGAEVCLCSNPEYNTSNDFHVLPNCEGEEFAKLQSLGCNVIGPDCILRCAKERRPFPASRYTCCMSLDGIRILQTGFEGPEKTRLQQLVTAMCGELVSKASMDVDFVVAKDVLAQKYKWAAFTLRKPILSQEWLVRCSREHRRVPHEPYRLPTFTGVLICTTGIPWEERRTIADLVEKHGGKLQPDLTRHCTHLIAKSSDSDKFKMAMARWRTTKCVNEQWFWNSLSENVCLEESQFAVNGTSSSCGHVAVSANSGPPPSQDKCSQASVSGYAAVVPPFVPEDDGQDTVGSHDTRGGQMYLSGCRIYLAGFDLAEMQNLVGMVVDGGGSRYMQFNVKITHVIFGKPADSDMKDVKQHAMWGAVHVVWPKWLEECSRQRREVPVNAQFVVPHALLVQDCSSRLGRGNSVPVMEKVSSADAVSRPTLSRKLSIMPKSQLDAAPHVFTMSQEKIPPRRPLSLLASNPANSQTSLAELKKPFSYGPAPSVKQDADVQVAPVMPIIGSPHEGMVLPAQETHQQKQAGSVCRETNAGQEQGRPSVTLCEDLEEESSVPKPNPGVSSHNHDRTRRVFEGHLFGFAPSFHAATRAEVIEWVVEGGGTMMEDVSNVESVELIICPHGPQQDLFTNPNVKRVTPQWIKYCLQESKLLDISSHILFRPLSCEIPLPGFQDLIFAASQYADRERILLYNLCHVLGAKYRDKKMTKRVTHLLCKVADGDKYEAALQWGIEAVTSDWLYACIAKNMKVSPGPFRPKGLTTTEKETGLFSTQCTPQFTPFDSNALPNDTEMTENHADKPLAAQAKHSETVEVIAAKEKRKGTLGNRIKAARPDTQGKRMSKACALSSQMANGNLDPWDELRATWTNENAAGAPSTTVRHQRIVRGEPPSLEPNAHPTGIQEVLSECSSQAKQDGGQKTVEDHPATSPSAAERREWAAQEGANKESDSFADVASAIEGLLAQTSKVQTEEASRRPGSDEDLLSPQSMQLHRRKPQDPHKEANFKRTKLMPERSCKSGSEELNQSLVRPSEDSADKFEESQWDSQVVDYDEDHSEKQRIMERVRTRSMYVHGSSGAGVPSGSTVQQRKKSWKSVEFSRLLKAADANKKRR